MRHLLIILSILILSSPVIGDNHKGETLYGWWKYPDYVWKRFGNKEFHMVFQGDVKNGKPNGQGTMNFTDGHKYIGDWKDGKHHGQGTKTWSDGSRYVGYWKDGHPWNGTFYDENGNISGKYVNMHWIKINPLPTTKQ